MYPQFKARQPHQIETAADQRRHRGGLLAQMSATVEPDPVTALQDFMTRRQGERDTRLTAFNTWAAGLNPRPVPIIDLQGSGPGGSGRSTAAADARYRGVPDRPDGDDRIPMAPWMGTAHDVKPCSH